LLIVSSRFLVLCVVQVVAAAGGRCAGRPAEQQGPLGLAEVRRDRVIGLVEGAERSVDLLDREVAGEQAALGAEGVDDPQHEGPQAVDGPGAVDHGQARDLATDVRSLGQQTPGRRASASSPSASRSVGMPA
jgi:hypothetical protein